MADTKWSDKEKVVVAGATVAATIIYSELNGIRKRLDQEARIREVTEEENKTKELQDKISRLEVERSNVADQIREARESDRQEKLRAIETISKLGLKIRHDQLRRVEDLSIQDSVSVQEASVKFCTQLEKDGLGCFLPGRESERREVESVLMNQHHFTQEDAATCIDQAYCGGISLTDATENYLKTTFKEKILAAQQKMKEAGTRRAERLQILLKIIEEKAPDVSKLKASLKQIAFHNKIIAFSFLILLPVFLFALFYSLSTGTFFNDHVKEAGVLLVFTFTLVQTTHKMREHTFKEFGIANGAKLRVDSGKLMERLRQPDFRKQLFEQGTVTGFKYLLDTGSLQNGELLGGFAISAGTGRIAICKAILDTGVQISPDLGSALIEKAVLESKPMVTEYLWQMGFTPGPDLEGRAHGRIDELFIELEQKNKDMFEAEALFRATKEKITNELYVTNNYAGDPRSFQKLRSVRKSIEECGADWRKKGEASQSLIQQITKSMECLEVFAWEPTNKVTPPSFKKAA